MLDLQVRFAEAVAAGWVAPDTSSSLEARAAGVTPDGRAFEAMVSEDEVTLTIAGRQTRLAGPWSDPWDAIFAAYDAR